MVGDDILAGDGLAVLFVDFGLHLIEGDPTLTFIFFLGISLLGALGLRFSYYAEQNMRQTSLEPQQKIWGYLRFIGVFGAVYAGIWLVEILTSFRFGPKNGVWLAMTLFLVFSLRQISITAGHGLGDELQPLDRLIRLGFVAAVGLYLLVSSVFGQSRPSAMIEGVTAICLLVYGGFYFRRQVASTRLQGTMLDSLLRHLLPVLAFAALVSIAALAIVLGIDRAVVLHVQLVFLIMTATALMTATIKLRQNLAGL